MACPSYVPASVEVQAVIASYDHQPIGPYHYR